MGKGIDAQLNQLALWSLALSCVLLLIAIWIAYLVVKSAIRDGIKESGLLEALRRQAAAPARQDSGLPDMRADR